MEKRSEEQKKEFAKEQVEFLKQQGIRDKDRISRIFRCSGPGQIREAWAMATSEDWSGPIGRVRKNTLDCIITGYGGAQELGWLPIVDVLHLAGFYIPKVNSSPAFFKVLDGALEIMIPGSFNFEDEEENGIENEEKTLQPSSPEP